MHASRKVGYALALCCLLLWRRTAVPAEVSGLSTSEGFTNIATLCRAAASQDRLHWNVEIEGQVCWSSPAADYFILEDASGAIPVSSDFVDSPLKRGDLIKLEGECSLRRDGLGFVLCQSITVNNDGLHDVREATGSIYLKTGKNPVRVLWFNSHGNGVLKLDYQGPGLPRQPIPSSALWRSSPDGVQRNSAQGLAYRSWTGQWDFLPSFRRIPVARSGSVTNFNISVAPRTESVGIEFTGFLDLPQDGLYTFYLQSDDGSALSVGPRSLRLEILGFSATRTASQVTAGQELSEQEEYGMHVMEGEVTFVDQRELSLRIELGSGENATRVDIVDARGAQPQILRGSRVRVLGLCRPTMTADGRKVAGYIWVPRWEDLEIIKVAEDRWELQPVVSSADLMGAETARSLPLLVRVRGKAKPVGADGLFSIADRAVEVGVRGLFEAPEPGTWIEALGSPHLESGRLILKGACIRPATMPEGAPPGKLPLLTTIAQVRELNAQKAVLAYPVQVRGVVTAKFENGMNFVIQNGEHGVYVSTARAYTRGPLEIGDLCEVIGITKQAPWAPAVVAQRVTRLGLGQMPEPLRPSRDQILNGSLDSQYIEIQGLVTEVDESGVKLLSRMGTLDIDLAGKTVDQWRQLQLSVVRLKGCVLAVYDHVTGLAISGKLRFIHPSITIDEFPAADPFNVPGRRIASLRAFNPQASPFQPVKVSGQITYAHGDLHCVMQGSNGMRFFPRKPAAVTPGALVDVSGILDLSGPSPSLHEAVMRQTGQAPLPEPVVMDPEDMLSRVRDATRVQVDALLLSSSRDSSDHVLELRAGDHVFRARLGAKLGVLKSVPSGSRVRVRGTYLGKGGDWSSGQEISSFDIALNSPLDVVVLQKPPWWTPKRLLMLVGGLAVILLLALVWIRVLRRQVEERTRQLTIQIRARQAVEQQRAVEQERTRLARDLHDDLGGGLTEISMLGFLANDAGLPQERKTGYLQQLTEKARDLVTALDEIVWAVNPRYDSLASLAAYCSLYAQRFLGLASLACHLQISDSLPDHVLDSNTRHGLFLAFKEALSNVVRHSGASEVTLRIETQADELLVSVGDNGRGLPLVEPSDAGMEGLQNMRDRLAGLGGDCEILSTPAAGTTVNLRVPLNGKRS